jgi:hypothetical protein
MSDTFLTYVHIIHKCRINNHTSRTLNGPTSILEVSSSNLDHELTTLTKNLVVFLISSRKMQGQYFKSGHNCPFYALSLPSSYVKLYSIARITYSIVKKYQTN